VYFPVENLIAWATRLPSWGFDTERVHSVLGRSVLVIVDSNLDQRTMCQTFFVFVSETFSFLNGKSSDWAFWNGVECDWIR